MSSANNFASFFPIFMPFFSCLISLATISSTVLNGSGESRTFQSFAIKYDVSCGFFKDVLYQIVELPFYQFLSVFIERLLEFVECFFYIYSLVFLINYLSNFLIDFIELKNHSCCCLIVNLCLFCDPIDYSPPGSSVNGIFQAKILEWFAISSPGDLPDPGIEPGSSALAGRFFTTEPPRKPKSPS